METEKQFSDIVGLIKQARDKAFKSINTQLINSNWQVGQYISNRIENANWGDKTVNDLAKFIEKNHPDLKGYNRRGLYRMKQFYEVYKNSSILLLMPKKSQLYGQKLKGYLDEVINGQSPLFVTRTKGENIVVLSQSDYDSIMETFYLLKSAKNAERLQRAINQYQQVSLLIK